jgi:hypothetical protein
MVSSASALRWRNVMKTAMRSVVVLLIVVTGLVTLGTSAHADHWPPDLWERLNCERH